jgi:hypothetical protein
METEQKTIPQRLTIYTAVCIYPCSIFRYRKGKYLRAPFHVLILYNLRTRQLISKTRERDIVLRLSHH